MRRSGVGHPYQRINKQPPAPSSAKPITFWPGLPLPWQMTLNHTDHISAPYWVKAAKWSSAKMVEQQQILNWRLLNSFLHHPLGHGDNSILLFIDFQWYHTLMVLIVIFEQNFCCTNKQFLLNCNEKTHEVVKVQFYMFFWCEALQWNTRHCNKHQLKCFTCDFTYICHQKKYSY